MHGEASPAWEGRLPPTHSLSAKTKISKERIQSAVSQTEPIVSWAIEGVNKTRRVRVGGGSARFSRNPLSFLVSSALMTTG